MTALLELAKTRQLVDQTITSIIEERLNSAHEIGPSYERFWQIIRDIVLAGGKRIRPHLTMIGYGGCDEKIIPVAVAQEMIHIAMLIHDDIIDQDDIRHGQKNITGRYLDVYESHTDAVQARHYANSAAIVAGDVLISEAYQLINNSSFEDHVKQRLSNQMATSIYEVVAGELMDVEASFMKGEAVDPLKIYRYKTSSYSFVGPILSGAYCSGADDSTCQLLEQIAINAGIAFQIQDDLLGVFGDETQTGKSTLSDLREGKQTLLVAHHMALFDETQARNFEAFGIIDTTDDALEQIKRDMDRSGAKQKTVEAIKYYFDLAEAAIDQLPMDNRRAELHNLVANLKGRNR